MQNGAELVTLILVDFFVNTCNDRSICQPLACRMKESNAFLLHAFNCYRLQVTCKTST